MHLSRSELNAHAVVQATLYSDAQLQYAKKEIDSAQAMTQTQLIHANETYSHTPRTIININYTLNSLLDGINSEFWNIYYVRELSYVINNIISLGHIKDVMRLQLLAGNHVFLASIYDVDNVAIVKTQSVDSDTQHEFLIGALVTNKLRSIIPNFMYVYGAFRAFTPIIINNQLIDWAFPYTQAQLSALDSWKQDFIMRSPISTYLIMENINNHIILDDDFFSDASEWEYYSILFQLIFALTIANDMTSYTHGDLGCQNVILRKPDIDEPIFYIPYTIRGHTYYVKAAYVATIIDYEYSYADLRDTGLGQLYADDVYKFPSKYPDSVGWSLPDLFLFLDTSRDILGDGLNDDIVEVVYNALDFFADHNDIVELGIYSIPTIRRDLDLMDLAQYLMPYADDVVFHDMITNGVILEAK